MTPNRHDVAGAQAAAEAARARLLGTLVEVQERLRPANLAQDAVDGAAQGVANAVRMGTDAARRRPFATAGVAAVFGLYMARGLIGRLLRRRRETPRAPTGLKRKAQ